MTKPILYHGSSDLLNIGDVLDPQKTSMGDKVVYAASEFGISMGNYALEYEGISFEDDNGQRQYVLFEEPKGYVYIVESETFEQKGPHIWTSPRPVLIKERIELTSQELAKRGIEVFKKKKFKLGAKRALKKAREKYISPLGTINSYEDAKKWQRVLSKNTTEVKAK